MNKIVIIGAGGQGREVAQLIQDINLRSNSWRLIGFIDDDPSKSEMHWGGYPVLGNRTHIGTMASECQFILAIGDSSVRHRIWEEMSVGLNFATLIHPTAVVSNTAAIGQGSMIFAHTVISTDVQIGHHVLVNYGTTIGHDATIGDLSSLYPGSSISGHVRLGQKVTIGSRAVVLPGLEVGQNSVIGAGAVVTRSISSNCKAVGVPAKAIDARPIRFTEGESP